MTAPETALAIIASHGADPARWPPADRAAVLALSVADADVAAALADARALDAVLGEWLAVPLPDMTAVNVAAITAAAPERTTGPVRPRIAGWRPMLMAASFAAMLATGGLMYRPGGTPAAPQTKIASVQSPPPSPVPGAGVGEADLAFAFVFTPTVAEEELI